MRTNYGILERDIDVKGFEFKKNTILRIWDAGSVVSIQPFFLHDSRFKAMWYMLGDEHTDSIIKLDNELMDSVDSDFPPTIFPPIFLS